MNEKLIRILDIIIDTVGLYLDSMVKVKLVENLIKKSVSHLIIFVVLAVVMLLSTLILIWVLIFFYLISLNLSIVQVLFIMLTINICSIIALFVWFKRIKLHIRAIHQSGISVFASYVFKAINHIRNKD